MAGRSVTGPTIAGAGKTGAAITAAGHTDIAQQASLPRVGPSLWLGILTLLLLLLGFGLWATCSQIAGAVIASVRVEIDGGRYSLQHPEGGTLIDIAIREGEEVEPGQVLARLDPERLLAERAGYLQQWSQLEAKRLRLEAELTDQDLLQDLVPPAAPGHALLAELLPKEARLLLHRRAGLQSTRALLDQRIRTAEEALQGVWREKSATGTQIRLLRTEAATQQNLRDQGLVQSAKLYSLQREIARLEGVDGEITVETAKLQGEITQAKTEDRRLQAARREELATDLRQTEAETGRLQAVLDMIDLRLRQTELRAPINGRIFGLQAGRPGRVLAPAEVLAQLIPLDAAPRIWLHIPPQNLHEVHEGQKVRLLFASLAAENRMVAGELALISPDVFTDAETGQSFYRAEVRLDTAPLDLALQAGLPLQAFIQTASHSPFAYLWAPAQRYFRKALREG